MLALSDVTVCCIDTRFPSLAMGAVRRCMDLVRFGDALLVTGTGHSLSNSKRSVRIVETGAIQSIDSYSEFLIKHLSEHIETSHVLIVQWDGFVIDPAMWDDEFLSYDYIGAVWPQYDDEYRVGNGGFSLRSKKLLKALESDVIASHHPEDVCIARTHRKLLEQRWGIRFADENLAHRFAFERVRQGRSSFGFHGMSNLPLAMSPTELENFIEIAPAELFASVEARGLIKRLISNEMRSAASVALRKRLKSRSLDMADLRLWLRYALT